MVVAIVCAFIMFISNWSEGYGLEDISHEKLRAEMPMDLETSPTDMDEAITRVETLVDGIDKNSDTAIVPLDESEEHYYAVLTVLDDIIEAVHNPKNAFMFLKANGLTRIVAPNIDLEHPELKTKLIILLKVLFDMAPVSTNAYIPTKILDVLVDVFENDDLALKAHALDVLAKWMPGNPRIQTRVMRLRGLEPFYLQVNKLDISGIKVLLDLFNKILVEHIAAREDTKLSKVDLEMYRRIGLIERMSTSIVCNGFLNIFAILTQYNDFESRDIFVTVYELVKNIEPFCIPIYKGKSNAVAVFEGLLQQIDDDANEELFNRLNSNLADFKDILRSYISKMKSYRDEL